MIELLALSVDETLELLQATSTADRIRGIAAATGAIGPDIVLRMGLERHRNGEDWFWCAERLFFCTQVKTIVGAGCWKGFTAGGEPEIGYGIASEWQGRGYATMGVAAMLAEARCHGYPGPVYAECAPDNPASMRVLTKNGFLGTGQRNDPEDGLLNCFKSPFSLA